MTQNGAVLIFPNATHRIQENAFTWKGIGRLVENLDEASLRNTLFAPLYIHGVTIGDVLSNIRTVVQGEEPKKHTMHITQGNPITGDLLLHELREDGTGSIQTHQRISNILESLYTQDNAFSTIRV
jgi:hypothetical protein